MTDIFLSYAREDLKLAEKLATALEDQGWSVFWDLTVPPGLTWDEFIASKLAESRSVVVAWSPDAVSSEWVREEAREAKRRGVLVPVLLGHVQPPFGFGSLQAVDLSEWTEGQTDPALGRLVTGLERILGPRPVAGALPQEGRDEAAGLERQEWPENERTPPRAPQGRDVDLGQGSPERRAAPGPLEGADAQPSKRTAANRRLTVIGAVVAALIIGSIAIWQATQPSEPSGVTDKVEEPHPDRARELDNLTGMKGELDRKRRQLDLIQGEQGVDEAEHLVYDVEALTDQFRSRLIEFIDSEPWRESEPRSDLLREAIRMKSSEEMLVALDYIEGRGDYKSAIQILENALIDDPDNRELHTVLANTRAERYMTPERFDRVEKGMGFVDVRLLLGQVNLHNIREYPEEDVIAWFYPTAEHGSAAAVWFRMSPSTDEFVVYRTDFEAVEPR